MSQYKEVGYWLRKNMATEWGGHGVPLWTMTDVMDYTQKMESKYGAESLEEGEDSYIALQLADGATHVVRCVIGCPGDLVDGVDIFIKLDGDIVEQVSEVDSPDLQGADYQEAQSWVLDIGLPIDA